MDYYKKYLKYKKKYLELELEGGATGTPFYKAVTKNNPDLIKSLFDQGKDPNELTIHNKLPLNQAIKMNHINAIKALVENGADINIKVGDKTPLDIASGEIKDYLLEKNTDEDYNKTKNKVIEKVKAVAKAKIDNDARLNAEEIAEAKAAVIAAKATVIAANAAVLTKKSKSDELLKIKIATISVLEADMITIDTKITALHNELVQAKKAHDEVNSNMRRSSQYAELETKVSKIKEKINTIQAQKKAIEDSLFEIEISLIERKASLMVLKERELYKMEKNLAEIKEQKKAKEAEKQVIDSALVDARIELRRTHYLADQLIDDSIELLNKKITTILADDTVIKEQKKMLEIILLRTKHEVDTLKAERRPISNEESDLQAAEIWELITRLPINELFDHIKDIPNTDHSMPDDRINKNILHYFVFRSSNFQFGNTAFRWNLRRETEEAKALEKLALYYGVVKRKPDVLKYFDENIQNEQMCMEAILSDPKAFRHVKNQTLKLCLLAIYKDTRQIKNVNKAKLKMNHLFRKAIYSLVKRKGDLNGRESRFYLPEITPTGITPTGITPTGITPTGITPSAISAPAISAPAISAPVLETKESIPVKQARHMNY